MPAAAPRMTAQEWLLLMFLSLLWGGSFFLSAVAVKEIEPFTLAFFRTGMAATALALAAFVLRYRFPREARVWGAFLIMGAASSAVPFSLLYWAQTEISGALASILNATTPLFTSLIAHAFTRDEKLNARRLAGLLAGMGGVVVIVGPSALADSGTRIAAEIAILGAALCYGVAGVYGKRFRGIPPVVTACGQLTFAALLILPMMLIHDHPLSRPLPSAVSVACVVALALFSTALAFIVYFRILTRAGATNVVLVTLLVPVSAILLGGLILGEVLEARHFGGMVLIACGLIIIDGRVVDYFRKPAMPDAAGPDASRMLNEPRNLQP